MKSWFTKASLPWLPGHHPTSSARRIELVQDETRTPDRDRETNKIFTHDENVKNVTNKTISRMKYGRCKNLKKYTRNNIFQNRKIADFRLCACNCLYYSRFLSRKFVINLSGSFMVYFEITRGRVRSDLRRHTDFCLILFVV